MKIHNKSSKPTNIVINENKLIERCISLENSMPSFLKDYFIFLKNSVSLTTRYAYLKDIEFFLKYLLSENPNLNSIMDISPDLINNFTARDFNYFIGEYCTRYEVYRNDTRVIYENRNRSLSRKKSSLVSLLKFLYRNDQITNNIINGLNPIKMPKTQPDAIKKLSVNEATQLIEIVETGNGLTEKEMQFWEKTKQRDRLIVLFFIMYGLRISELQSLNLSSFNYNRNEFKIFRKRSKEVDMPLDEKIKGYLLEYLETERKTQKISEKDADALFLSRQGTRLTTRAIQNLIKKYTSIAMGTTRENGYSPHKLRATAASSMIEFGFSIYDVQNLLDHDSVLTTQLYAAHRKNAKKEILESLEWIK